MLLTKIISDEAFRRQIHRVRNDAVGKSRLRSVSVLCLAIFQLTSVGCATFRARDASDDVVAARELCRLGLHAMDEGRYRDATARFSHALDICPDDLTTRRHQARALWQVEQRDDAIAQMETVVKMSGDDPTWTVELGRMLLTQGELGVAMGCANWALDADSQLAEAWVLRADVLHRQGSFQEALDHYHRGRGLGASDPRVVLRIAEIYEQQGRPHRVLATLQRLESDVELASMGPEVLLRQGMALRQLERFDDAIDVLSLARQQQANDSEILVQLAECQLQVGQIDEARLSASEAARIADSSKVRTLLTRVQAARQEVAGNAALDVSAVIGVGGSAASFTSLPFVSF